MYDNGRLHNKPFEQNNSIMNRFNYLLIILIFTPIIRLVAQQSIEISFEARHYEGEDVGSRQN